MFWISFLLNCASFLGFRDSSLYHQAFATETGCLLVPSKLNMYEPKYLHDLFSYTKAQALRTYIMEPILLDTKTTNYLQLLKPLVGVLSPAGDGTVSALFTDENVMQSLRYAFYLSISGAKKNAVIKYLEHNVLDMNDPRESSYELEGEFEYCFYNRTTQTYRRGTTLVNFKYLTLLSNYYPVSIFVCYSDIDDAIRSIAIIPVDSFNECAAFGIKLLPQELTYDNLGAFSSMYVMSSLIVTTTQIVLLQVRGSAPTMQKIMSDNFSFITLSQGDDGHAKPAVYSKSKICIFEYMPKIFDQQYVILDVVNNRMIYSVPSDIYRHRSLFPPSISMSKSSADGTQIAGALDIIPTLGFSAFGYVDISILANVAKHLRRPNWMSKLMNDGMPLQHYMGVFAHKGKRGQNIIHIKAASTDSLPDPFSFRRIKRALGAAIIYPCSWVPMDRLDKYLLHQNIFPCLSKENFHIDTDNPDQIQTSNFVEDLQIIKTIVSKPKKTSKDDTKLKKHFKDKKDDIAALSKLSSATNILNFLTSTFGARGSYHYIYGSSVIEFNADSTTEHYAARQVIGSCCGLTHNRLSRGFSYSAELKRPTIGFKHAGKLLACGLGDLDFEVNNSFYGQNIAIPVALGMNVGMGYAGSVAPYVFTRFVSNELFAYKGFVLKTIGLAGYLNMDHPNVMIMQNHPAFFAHGMALHPGFSRAGYGNFIAQLRKQPYYKLNNAVLTSIVYVDKTFEILVLNVPVTVLTTAGIMANNSYGASPVFHTTIFKRFWGACVGVQLLFNVFKLSAPEPMSICGIGIRPFITASMEL